MTDLARGAEPYLDILVVAVDANCFGVRQRQNDVRKAIGDSYAGQVVVATPDPHIERWYLAVRLAQRGRR